MYRDMDDKGEMTYGAYMLSQERRSWLEAARCVPLRDYRQKKLLLLGAALFNVGLLLALLDRNESDASPNMAAGLVAAGLAYEARLLMAISIALSGFLLLCYLFALRRSGALAMTRPLADLEAGSDDPDVAIAEKPLAWPSRGRDYGEILRLIKAREKEAHDLYESPADIPGRRHRVQFKHLDVA